MENRNLHLVALRLNTVIRDKCSMISLFKTENQVEY